MRRLLGIAQILRTTIFRVSEERGSLQLAAATSRFTARAGASAWGKPLRVAVPRLMHRSDAQRRAVREQDVGMAEHQLVEGNVAQALSVILAIAMSMFSATGSESLSPTRRGRPALP